LINNFVHDSFSHFSNLVIPFTLGSANGLAGSEGGEGAAMLQSVNKIEIKKLQQKAKN
jgi:hypothetical protein